MLFQYAIVAFGLIFGFLFVLLNVAVIQRLLSPKIRNAAKETTYECGEPAIGSAWVRFDMRFYTMALVFLIFEVETVFLFPWSVVFKPLSEAAGLFVFLEMAFFIAILLVGLAYVWVRGDLDWVKGTAGQETPAAGRAAATDSPE